MQQVLQQRFDQRRVGLSDEVGFHLPVDLALGIVVGQFFEQPAGDGAEVDRVAAYLSPRAYWDSLQQAVDQLAHLLAGSF